MKISTFVAGLLASCAVAEDLVFTYMTLKNGEVSTATTSFANKGTPAPPTSPGQTSYSVDPADLIYPTPVVIAPAVAEAAAAPGYPNATEFADMGLALIQLLQDSNSTNCKMCQDTMHVLQKSLEKDQELIGRIAVPFCEKLPFIPMDICVGLFRIGSTDVGAVFGSWATDFRGQDGQLLCAYLFGLCDLTSPPYIDTRKLFKNTTKPAPKVLTPSTKEPLKVSLEDCLVHSPSTSSEYLWRMLETARER